MDQIRSFRLHNHHLDRFYPITMVKEAAGICGFQNSPPGAWENALFNRISGITKAQLEAILYEDRSLLQAWSYRGAPVVFPVDDSDVFLSALIPMGNEPWIYTNGISLALDYLDLRFDVLFNMLKQALSYLDTQELISKINLDQILADQITPMLPTNKQVLWTNPSMYGNPAKQTVGGDVVSFLLRPCSYQGTVVFAKRIHGTPSFTSYKRWTGHEMPVRKDVDKELVRRFLHAFGPASLQSLISWLGCSKEQGMRMWQTAADEIMPVKVQGKTCFLLKADESSLFAPAVFSRELLLLSSHDPYLDLRDRAIIQDNKRLQKQIWRLVSNPGVILKNGAAIGIWNVKKKDTHRCIVSMTLWELGIDEQQLRPLADAYVAFQCLNRYQLELKYEVSQDCDGCK